MLVFDSGRSLVTFRVTMMSKGPTYDAVNLTRAVMKAMSMMSTELQLRCIRTGASSSISGTALLFTLNMVLLSENSMNSIGNSVSGRVFAIWIRVSIEWLNILACRMTLKVLLRISRKVIMFIVVLLWEFEIRLLNYVPRNFGLLLDVNRVIFRGFLGRVIHELIVTACRCFLLGLIDVKCLGAMMRASSVSTVVSVSSRISALGGWCLLWAVPLRLSTELTFV